MRSFSPVFEMRKGQRTWERVLVPNSRNQVNMAKHKNFNFRAYHNFGNPSSCITAVKSDAYDLEYTAVNARWCHPDRRHNSSGFHPDNRAEVFSWQNFQPAYRDLGWKKRDLGNRAGPPSHMKKIEIFTKDLEVRRDLGNPASQVNRVHVKRP